MTILNDCAILLERLRERVPLVHHLTNYVTVNDCANVTLAIGASPIMATAIEEAGAIAQISAAVVINIGTLNPDGVQAMLAAGKSANAHGVPVVFDPVGAGASTLRSETTARILAELKLAVIRGNISEVRAAGGLTAHTKGVDAGRDDAGSDAGECARALAKKAGCVVAVTGPVDVISDGRTTLQIANGRPELSKISGTGCMCTSLVGAFVGTEPGEPLLAAAAALLCMGIAGETAFARAGAAGLGSYRLAVMDAIGRMDGETLIGMGRISETEN